MISYEEALKLHEELHKKGVFLGNSIKDHLNNIIELVDIYNVKSVCDYYYMNRNEIGAIHYTDGGPWFKDYKKTIYSDIWRKMKDEFCNTEERYNLVY